VHYQPAVEIVADIPSTLREFELLERMPSTQLQIVQADSPQRMAEDIASYALKEREPFYNSGCSACPSVIVKDDDLLISDVGQS